jgi:ribonuclease P protein component
MPKRPHRWKPLRTEGGAVPVSPISPMSGSLGLPSIVNRWSRDREAHLSTLQARPQAPPWFSLADGNRRWPQGPGKPPREGPQASFGLILLRSCPAARLAGRGIDTVMRSAPVQTLPKRADFLRAASHGQKSACRGFVVQILKTTPDAPVRLGLTASRKVGNAVCRNRARRRLREVARRELRERPRRGADIVLIARKATATVDFAALRGDLRSVLDRTFAAETVAAP